MSGKAHEHFNQAVFFLDVDALGDAGFGGKQL